MSDDVKPGSQAPLDTQSSGQQAPDKETLTEQLSGTSTHAPQGATPSESAEAAVHAQDATPGGQSFPDDDPAAEPDENAVGPTQSPAEDATPPEGDTGAGTGEPDSTDSSESPDASASLDAHESPDAPETTSTAAANKAAYDIYQDGGDPAQPSDDSVDSAKDASADPPQTSSGIGSAMATEGGHLPPPAAPPVASPMGSTGGTPGSSSGSSSGPPSGPPKDIDQDDFDDPEDGDADDDEDEGEEGAMGFFEHLTELRIRLVRCVIAALLGFLACYSVAEELFGVLMEPLVRVFPPDTHLIFTSLPEAFFTYMTVAAVAGVFLVSPYIFYQIWCFVAPGLYEEERKALMPIAFFSAFFFVGGAMFGYHVVFPNAFEFFMGYTTDIIKPLPALKEYLRFSLKLLFAFGVIFELPLVVYFLARLGLVTAHMMRKYRKYAILCNFMLAAFLTPPDLISQLFMAGPLLILYELSIYVALLFGRKKPAPATEEEDERDDLAEDEEDAAADEEQKST